MVKRLASGDLYFIEYDDKIANQTYLSSITFKSPGLGTHEEVVFNKALEIIENEQDWEKAKEILEQGGLVPIYSER